MIYLLLAVICSSTIALVFKYSETRNLNRYAVTSTNYAAAGLIGLGFILKSRGGISDLWEGYPRIPRVVRRILTTADPLPDTDLVGWAVLIGSLAGIFFFLAFIYYQKSVRDHGVGLAGAFAKMGIFVPMTLSLLFWREIPEKNQWAGMGCAVCAIIVSHWPIRTSSSDYRSWTLLLLFLFGGCAEFSNKVFQHYGSITERPIFLFITFTLALVLSVIALLRCRLPVRFRDIRTGLLVGIPNLFSSYFLIRALVDVPASAAFPIFGAGTIAIIGTVGVIAFKERLTVKNAITISLVILSIILVGV